MIKRVVIFCISILLLNQASASNYNYSFDSIPDQLSVNHFVLNNCILNIINNHRRALDLDTLRFKEELASAGEDFSKFLKKNEVASFKKSITTKRINKYLQKYNGSNKVEHLILKARFSTGDYDFTYREISQNLVQDILTKHASIIENHELKYIGIGFKKIKDKRKLVGVIFLGSYKSINTGLQARLIYKYPSFSRPFANLYRTNYFLKEYNKGECSKCAKFNFYQDLLDNIYIENNRAYLDYHDKRNFYRLFRNPKDGIAIDIIFKSQYPCNESNILNHDFVNKGLLFRPIYKNGLIRRNKIKTKRDNNLKLKLPKLYYVQDFVGSRTLKDPYEINLLIIQNKHVCKVISPQHDFLKLDEDFYLVPDTFLIQEIIEKKTFAYSNQYNFTIPFKKGKHTYSSGDIKPFVKALNRYNHNLKSIEINAYSSIEGNTEHNKELQTKRAESIISILQKNKKGTYDTKINTEENWAQFYQDIQETDYSLLKDKPKDEILNYVNSSNNPDLELILKNHRYAKVNMHVEYQFETEYEEEEFFVNRYKKYLGENNIDAAKYYQTYILKNIIKNEFSDDCISKIEIPEERAYSGLLLNQFWITTYSLKPANKVNTHTQLHKLYMLDSLNVTIKYNYSISYIYTKENIDDFNKPYIENQIQSLKKSYLPDTLIKKLELEYKLKYIDLVLRKHNNNDESTIQRLLSEITITESNSILFARVFLKRGQYEIAMKMLEPFANTSNLNNGFWITYLSTFNLNNKNTNNSKFVNVLTIYKQLFPDKFSSLIGNEFFSIQIFENPDVKKLFCN